MTDCVSVVQNIAPISVEAQSDNFTIEYNVIQNIAPVSVETYPGCDPVRVDILFAGPIGPSPTGSFTSENFEVTALISGAQNHLLLTSPGPLHILTINGLRQSVSAYSFSGASLVLPASLNIIAGDLIQLLHMT